MTTFQYLDGGNIEDQDRLATSFLLAQASPGLATTGVLSGLAVTQTATASDSVLISAGAAPIQASVLTGVAMMVNDTTATLEVLTSHPMGELPRHDIVVMDSVTKAISVIVGTPDATPDDPTVPTSACALARLRHLASATTIPTSAIDDLRAPTGLDGAILRASSAAQRDALQSLATTTRPLIIDRTDTGAIERIDGSAVRFVSQGLQTKAFSAVVTTGAGGSFTIAYYSAFSASCLAVVGSLADSNGTAVRSIELGVGSTPLSSCTGIAYNASGVGVVGAPIRVNAIAIGY